MALSITKPTVTPLANDDIYRNEVVDCRPGERIELLGRCTGSIYIDDFSKTDIIVKDHSHVNILVSGIAEVNIYLHNNAWVNVGARNGANVICHRFGIGFVFSSSFSGSSVTIANNREVECFQ